MKLSLCTVIFPAFYSISAKIISFINYQNFMLCYENLQILSTLDFFVLNDYTCININTQQYISIVDLKCSPNPPMMQ